MSDAPEKSLLTQGKSTRFLFTFLISFAIAKMLGITFTKIFTNVLTKEEMGQYTIIISATALILGYAALVFPNTLNRYAIWYKTKQNFERLRNFIFTSFITFLIAEVLIISGLLIYYFVTGVPPGFLDVEQFLLTLLLIAVIVIAQFFSTIAYTIASSLQNSRYYAVIIIMRVLLQVPFGILFVIGLDLGVFGLIAALAVSEFTVAFYSGYRIIKDVGIGRYSLSELKNMAKFSLPIYVTALLWYTFDLGILLYVEAVAFDPTTGQQTIALYRYGALTVVNLVTIAGTLFSKVYRPVVYKHFDNKNFKKIEELTITITKIFSLVFFPIAVLLLAFSPWLIQFFTLSEYLGAIGVIPILLVAAYIQYLQSLVTYGHILYFKLYWNIIVGTLSWIITILVAYFTIPINGLYGLSLAYLTRRLTYLIGFFFVSQKYFKVNYNIKEIIHIVSVFIISAGVGTLMYFFVFDFLGWWNITVSFSISALIFVGLAFLTKLVTKEDWNFISDLFKNYFKGVKPNKTEN